MSEKIRIGLLHSGGPEELAALSLKAANAAQAFSGNKYEFITVPAKEAGKFPEASSFTSVDVVLPFMSGGDSGLWRVRSIAEITGLPVIGPGWKSAALGLDRIWIRKVLAHDGLPQVMFRHFTRAGWERDQEYYLTEIEVTLGYPCRVRPASGPALPGSDRVRSREELAAAIEEALQTDKRVIVEELVEGRSFQAALIGGSNPEVSDIGEIVGGTPGGLAIPKDLKQEAVSSMKELAVHAFASLDASGAALVRLVMDQENGRILLEDWESFPPLVPDAPYAKLWRLMGKSYAALLDRWIELAAERHAGGTAR